MNRAGHLSLSLFAFSLALAFQPIPLSYYLFVLLGAMLPDFDLPMKGLHRKLFHNIWFAVIMGLLIADNLGTLPAQLFLIGFATHVLGDALTPEGVHLLWPGKKKLQAGKMKTGGMLEYSVTLLMFFAAFALLFHHLSFGWTKALYVSGFLVLGLVVVWLRPP